MDEVIWIEVLGRQRETLARQRVTTDRLSLGRAYDNDIVVDDPHVAAHHLALVRDAEGAWFAEDLGSVNGLFVDGARGRRERVTLDGTTTLRIGHTYLRLRHASDAVAPEEPLARDGWNWPLAIACLVLVFALEWLGLWLAETGEPKLLGYLTPLLWVAVVIAVWATAWSVLSRVFKGHARFGRHLLIVSAGVLAFSAFQQLAEFGAFALSWPGLAQYVYIAGWLALAAVCFAHLRALGRSHLVLKAVAVIALAALGITMTHLRMSEWRANYGQAAILQRLQPPWMRLVSAKPASTFFAGSAALQAGLDAARSEEPPDGEDLGLDDSD